MPLTIVQMFTKGETTVAAADEKENRMEARHFIVPVSILLVKQNTCLCCQIQEWDLDDTSLVLDLHNAIRPACGPAFSSLLSPFLELMFKTLARNRRRLDGSLEVRKVRLPRGHFSMVIPSIF